MTNETALLTDASVNLERMNERYDSDDSFQFYMQALGGGGASVHYGIYPDETTTTIEASDNATRRLLELGQEHGFCISDGMTMLDSGAGNGVSAHLLAKETSISHITCLNLCARQNKYNEELVSDLGLTDRVEVVEGSFDSLPKDWVNKFDVIWSQEAFLHSLDKRSMLEQAHKALRSRGWILFSDTMASEKAKKEDLGILASRMKVKQLHSLSEMRSVLEQVGFEVLGTEDHSEELMKVYEHMKRSITRENREKLDKCSDGFIQGILGNVELNMKVLAERPAQTWQFVVCRKTT